MPNFLGLMRPFQFTGYKRRFLVDTGVQAGIRQTRSTVGIDMLWNEDVLTYQKRPDGTSKSSSAKCVPSAIAGELPPGRVSWRP
jgi:hypothetical protein